MSQPIVQSITEEELNELEEICRQKAFTCCGNHSVGGEYMGSQELVCCMEPLSTELDISWPAESILELITRLRAAEKNAARYERLSVLTPYRFRKLQEACTIGGGNVFYFRRERFNELLDLYMEQQP